MYKAGLFLCTLMLLLSAEEPIFTCDFNNESIGTYTFEQVKAAWMQPTWNSGVDEGRAKIVDENGNKVLEIFYPANTFGTTDGGAQWEMDLVELYDTLWVSYKIKFQASFDFVRGGKLPGLGGGTTPTGGQETTGKEGFSARIMWRWKNTGDGKQGAMCQYIYHMDKPGMYGEDLYWAYPNHGWSSTRRYFIPGKWHTVKTRIIMNTPGQHNGRITSWLDDDLGLDSILRFRAEGITTFANDKFLFSTFFGGGDDTWATTKDEYIYFDDFIISKTDPDQTALLHQSVTTPKISFTQSEKSLRLYISDKAIKTLEIYDHRGRLLTTLHSNNSQFVWNHQEIATGIYFISHKNKSLMKVEIP